MSDITFNVSPETQLPEVPWRRWQIAFNAYIATTNIYFTGAIWVIYLASHGYSPLMIGLMETVFHIAKFVAEIPTGIFADLLGKRRSLIIFCVIGIVETLLFLIPSPFWITISFILSGTAHAFRGGANEALLWNLSAYPDAHTQAERYSKLVSRMYLIWLVSEIVGTTLGGYLGNALQALPFIARAVFLAIGILPLLLIPELKGDVPESEGRPKNPLRHFRNGLQAVWRRPGLMGLLLIAGLTDGCWHTVYYYHQLFLYQQGFGLEQVGVVVGVGVGISFVFTALTPRIMRYISEWQLVSICTALQMLGLLMISIQQSVVSLIGYLVFFQIGIAVLVPAISTYINQRSPEEQRATVLSLQTALFSAAMVVLFPLFGLGLVNVSYSVMYFYTLVALVSGSIGILLLVYVRRRALLKSGGK